VISLESMLVETTKYVYAAALRTAMAIMRRVTPLTTMLMPTSVPTTQNEL
jgi:hypothetical protein